MKQRNYSKHGKPGTEAGLSLVMVLIILVATSLLGVGGAQIAMMSERGARNDRDQQIAWQAAEAGIMDAERDISNSASTRQSLFDGKSTTAFLSGCGTSGTSLGLCTLATTGKQAWLLVDFTNTSGPTTAFGAFTGATYPAGSTGIQPELPPHYVIELVPDNTGDATSAGQGYVYRVTAMGFGPRKDIQAVVQTIYRI
jgi:type IV pilus assembly protein PilX